MPFYSPQVPPLCYNALSVPQQTAPGSNDQSPAKQLRKGSSGTQDEVSTPGSGKD